MRTLVASLAFFIAVLTFMPVTAQAELIGPLDPIFPEACRCENIPVLESNGLPGTQVVEQSAPGFGCVLQVIQNIIRLVISLAIVLCVLALVYTGFQWMTAGANADKKTQGRNLFLNTVVGIVIILTAWLIVDFVMKTFYAEETTFGPWHSILGSTGSDQCLVARAPGSITSGTIEVITSPNASGGGTGVGVSTPGTMTDTEVRAAFAGAGIEVATSLSSTNTFANTNRDTVRQAIAVKEACDCRVVVTATTGGSHESSTHSHANGFKIDLDDTRELNLFLMNTLRRNGSRGSDPRYLDSCGNEYVYEDPGTNGNPGPRGSHWDIKVTQGACSLDS